MSFSQLADLLQECHFDVHCYRLPLEKLCRVPLPSAFLIVSLFYFITDLGRSRMMVYLQARLGRSLNTRLFHHLLHLPFQFFAVRSSGDLIYSLNSALAVMDLFASRFMFSVLNCGAGIVILLYIFSLSRMLGFLACLLFLLNAAAVAGTRPMMIDSRRSVITSQSRVQSSQIEAVSSILGIKLCALENDIFQSWENAYDKYYQKSLENEKLQRTIKSVNGFLQFISPILLLFAGILLAGQQTVTIGAVVAVYSLGGNFFSVSTSVLEMWSAYIDSSVIIDRLADILDSQTEPQKQLICEQHFNVRESNTTKPCKTIPSAYEAAGGIV